MSIAPIVIDLLVKGAPQVAQSFKGVQDAAARAEKQMQRDAERAEKQRIATANREAREKVRIMAKVDRDVARIQDQAVRATEKAEREKQRIIEREARERARIHRRAVDEVERIEEKARANNKRRLEQETRDRERAAMQWVKTREKEQRDAAKSRERIASGMVGAAGRGVITGMQRVGGMTMGLAQTAAQLGGGFSIADSVERRLGAQRTAANIAASTMGQKVTSKEILGSASATGIKYGMDTEDVLAGIAQFKDLTGDTKRAMAIAPELAKLATAFGGDVGELAQNAGNIAMSSPNMTNDDVMRLLRVQTAQGAAGAVELKDLAKYGGRLTAGASLFGGDRSTNIATMGAFAQVARQHGGAASPAEAAMAAQRFGTDVAKHSADLEAQGIKVKDGKGNLRAADQIMMDMIEKSGGDVTKFGQMGLGERGVRVLTGFGSVYKQAGGGEKGKQAVRNELAKYTQGVSDQEIDTRAKERLSEEDKKLAIAMNELRTAAGQELLPEILKAIPAIKDLVPAMVDAAKVGIPAFTDLMKAVASFVKGHKGEIEWLAAHPIGAIVAAEVTKSFAAAALPGLLRSLMTAAFGGGGGGPPTPPPGAAGGGSGAVIAAGAVAQVYSAYDLVKGTRGALSEGRAAGADLAARLAAGDPAAQAELDKAKAQSSGVNVTSAYMDRAQRAVSAALNPAMAIGGYLGDEATKAITGTSADERARATLKASETVDTVAIARLESAIRENTTAVAGRTSNSGPNGAGRSEPIINR